MRNYLNLLQQIVDTGRNHDDRTGVGRRSIVGAQLRFDLSDGHFPIVTTRKINPMLPIAEMLFFIHGQTNVNYLHNLGFKFWDGWAVKNETFTSFVQKLVDHGHVPEEHALLVLSQIPRSLEGEIGPMYGSMWRGWPRVSQDIPKSEIRRSIDEMPKQFVEQMKTSYQLLDEEQKALYTEENWIIGNYYSAIDQLNELILNLKEDPYSSRHLVTAFNPEFNPVPGYSPSENVLFQKGALMPCHYAFQVIVSPPNEGEKPKLNLVVNLRSADVPIGTPANIAGYAFLLAVLAHVTDMDRGELVMNLADAHIYLDQLELVKEQLQREPLPMPKLILNPEKKDLFDFTMDDVTIEGYEHLDPIKYPVAI